MYNRFRQKTKRSLLVQKCHFLQFSCCIFLVLFPPLHPLNPILFLHGAIKMGQGVQQWSLDLAGGWVEGWGRGRLRWLHSRARCQIFLELFFFFEGGNWGVCGHRRAQRVALKSLEYKIKDLPGNEWLYQSHLLTFTASLVIWCIKKLGRRKKNGD